MLRELKSGNSLLIYIDGNTGADDKSILHENLIKINFLKEAIYARKGVAYFSHLAQIPIVVVANYKVSPDEIKFEFFDPIYPAKDMTRSEYIRMATQRIYDELSQLVLQYPGQWESWLNLHSIIKPNEFTSLYSIEQSLVDENQLRFNLKLFGLFNINKEFFLFNKRNYSAVPVNLELYNQLEKSIVSPVEKNVFSKNISDQLIANKVLL